MCEAPVCLSVDRDAGALETVRKRRPAIINRRRRLLITGANRGVERRPRTSDERGSAPRYSIALDDGEKDERLGTRLLCGRQDVQFQSI